MKKGLVASLAVASTIGFLTPLTSQAFGLGKLELQSALNQPFKAEIDVTALKAGERENLEVNMASSFEFSKAGLDRPILLTKFKFDIVEKQGQVKILITSKDPVKEPFLDFLLTATTGQGKLLREYTVLLDPPEFVMAEINKPTVSTTPVQEPVEAKTTTNTTSYQYTKPSYDSGTYGPVQKSESLWNIALSTRPEESVSVHQMMLALVKANPNAFTNENINGLKAGTTLKIPSIDTITSLTKSEAFSAVKSQNTAWKNRNKAATDVMTPVVSETQAQQSESVSEAPVEASAPDTDMPPSIAKDSSEPSDASLKLLTPEDIETTNQDASPSALGSSEVEKLSEQLTLAQETIEAQAQENVDFQERMAALEEQVETLRRMLSIKDADLAKLQDILEEENPELAVNKTSEQADAASVETVTSTDGTDSNNAQETIEQALPQDSDVSSEPASESEVLDSTADMLGLESEQVHSLFQQVKAFVVEHKIETGVGVLLFLILLLALFRRKNKAVTWNDAVSELDETAQHEVTNAPLQSNDEPAELEESQVEAPAVKGSSKKTAAELVEQADMFVGYADYIQAKTALEQARVQEPDNSLVAYKLLFVFYKQGQAKAFIDLVEASGFDESSDEWNEIKQWGHELEPENTLFNSEITQESKPETPAETFTETLDPTEPETMSESTIETENIAEVEENNIAFDLNDFASETPADLDTPEEIADDNELSFDLNEQQPKDEVEDTLDIDTLDLSEVAAEPELNEPETLDDIDEDDSLLSFDAESFSPQETNDEEELNIEDDGLDDLEFDVLEASDKNDDPSSDLELDIDLSEPEESEMEFDIGDIDDIDEAETKLDLAAAYIDMGDPAGAKSILNEVLVEGNEDQKTRAHTLLDSMS